MLSGDKATENKLVQFLRDRLERKMSLGSGCQPMASVRPCCSRPVEGQDEAEEQGRSPAPSLKGATTFKKNHRLRTKLLSWRSLGLLQIHKRQSLNLCLDGMSWMVVMGPWGVI